MRLLDTCAWAEQSIFLKQLAIWSHDTIYTHETITMHGLMIASIPQS